MPQQNVAVIGGGPKAAALAAKAFCLQQAGVPIRLTIFERSAIGSAWTGKHGYTDGDQRLCTPAERDLGFPYEANLGSEIAQQMQASFSWAAYKVFAHNASRYADWVSRGRKPPTHRDFAEYIEWAVEKSGAEVYFGIVSALTLENDRWTVVQKTAEGTIQVPDFHGVVVTGPGPANKLFDRVKDPRVFTGEDFWSRFRGVRKILRSGPKRIVVIGGGGTAAAIAAWFVRTGMKGHEIALLTDQPTLFTRTTNFFENRLFDDETIWKSLSAVDRRNFTDRLNRGVVWENVTELLADAEQLSLVPGRATGIEHGNHRQGAPRPDLMVKYTNHLGNHEAQADLVVDATGFNPWWFERLLPKELRNHIINGDVESQKEQRKQLQQDMRPDLSLELPVEPRIHAPMLSQVVGPGFVSLMVLGAMADRILNHYSKNARTS
ncbi:MAG: hydroxylase [Mesorhizobium sp.]|uniref:SidA/IucD/PvdA family monooxygenase n=1 Tax=Mesorhizobium sp. TaxID=1871066 RepID=UPI00121C6038|nr:SidA/IucD/PvdA family monooxygenase [Mesorhizobium sp.]TIO80820.1 MAG: hydroxylase [Mesorhizobium sp.]